MTSSSGASTPSSTSNMTSAHDHDVDGGVDAPSEPSTTGRVFTRSIVLERSVVLVFERSVDALVDVEHEENEQRHGMLTTSTSTGASTHRPSR
jgi:hypothetical protein